jgi:site-specific DNA-cytosine methylase
MGFSLTTAFPGGTPRAKRYQMAANAVSPQVSRAAARAIYQLLTGSEAPAEAAAMASVMA